MVLMLDAGHLPLEAHSTSERRVESRRGCFSGVSGPYRPKISPKHPKFSRRVVNAPTLTAFENARSANLSKICPDDCFLGFQSVGLELVANVSKFVGPKVIIGPSWTIFFAIPVPLTGTLKTNRRYKFEFRGVFECCKGSECFCNKKGESLKEVSKMYAFDTFLRLFDLLNTFGQCGLEGPERPSLTLLGGFGKLPP